MNESDEKKVAVLLKRDSSLVRKARHSNFDLKLRHLHHVFSLNVLCCLPTGAFMDPRSHHHEATSTS